MVSNSEVYTSFVQQRKRQKSDLFKDKLVQPLPLSKEGKDRLAIFNSIKLENERLAKQKICERTLMYKNPEMSIINKKMKMNQLNERKLYEIEQTIKKLEFEEIGQYTSRSNLSEQQTAPNEEVAENPSSYLNIINYETLDGGHRTVMKAPVMHGLISRPPSALNQLIYNSDYNMTADNYLKNIKSLKQFSNETDITNVNISKRMLKQVNKENVDERTLDYYYELIRGRDLNLIDEMNTKYSNIKLDL